MRLSRVLGNLANVCVLCLERKSRAGGREDLIRIQQHTRSQWHRLID